MNEVPNELRQDHDGLGGPQQNLQSDQATNRDDQVLVVRVGYAGFFEPDRPCRGDQRLSQGEVFALHGDDEQFEAKDEFRASWWAGEEEGDDRVRIGRVMGDEEPGAAFGFFVGLGLVYGLGKDRDTARVGASVCVLLIWVWVLGSWVCALVIWVDMAIQVRIF